MPIANDCKINIYDPAGLLNASEHFFLFLLYIQQHTSAKAFHAEQKFTADG